MSSPYIGQIIMFGGNFPPSGWALCNGQLIPISENDTLFNLIGTTYGGDGTSTFALPDLQGRVPVHMGAGSGLSNYIIGEKTGNETVTLTTNQIPQHNHTVQTRSGTDGNSKGPTSTRVLADEGSTASGGNAFTYSPFNAGTPNQVQMANTSISNTGGNQPHENRQPILTINYCISLFGVFPSQN